MLTLKYRRFQYHGANCTGPVLSDHHRKMFLLYALVAGLALGFLFRGRVAGLLELDFRWSGLMLAGLVVQVALFSDVVAERVGELGPPIYVASTLAVLVAVIRNIRIPGLLVVVAGAASNLAAIVANGGYMPASPSALAAIGRAPATIYSNSAVVPDPALWPLTDIFALPRWVPFTNVFSIGDILIGLGVIVTIVVAMRRAADQRTPGELAELDVRRSVRPDNSVERPA